MRIKLLIHTSVYITVMLLKPIEDLEMRLPMRFKMFLSRTTDCAIKNNNGSREVARL